MKINKMKKYMEVYPELGNFDDIIANMKNLGEKQLADVILHLINISIMEKNSVFNAMRKYLNDLEPIIIKMKKTAEKFGMS